MFDTFEQDIFKAVSGRFNFRDGVTLASDPHFDWEDPRATEKHELLHQELVDLSVFGWFQRLLLNLYMSEAVPPDHKEIYRRVFSQTMKHSYKVHEGLASYRTLTWYQAYTSSAPDYLNTLPPAYREALGLFEPLLPEYAGVDARDQAGIHAICDVLGVYFMNAPLPAHYQDWSLLGRTELPYINVDSPDHRLQQIGPHADEVSRILAGSLSFISTSIIRNRGIPDDYWAWFDETLGSLHRARPASPICGFFERGPLCAAMLRRWHQEIDQDYARYLFNAETEARLSQPRDVSAERLEATRFHSLNIGNALDKYEECALPDIRTYLKKILDINAADNLAFIITTANPTDSAIPVGKRSEGAQIPPGAIWGLLLEVDKASLRRSKLRVADRKTFTFEFPLSAVGQASRLIPEHNIVRFIHAAFYDLLAKRNLLDSSFHIVRITEHGWFEKTFDPQQFQCFGFITHENRRAFCYFRDRSLYFYLVATGQELSIRRVLGDEPGDFAPFESLMVDNIGLTLGQLALLGFFGGAL